MNLYEKAFRVGREISGPLFLPFLNWVTQESINLNIDHVLFLARDGQLFHKIAVQNSHQFCPQFHYFYAGSRASWYRCTPQLLSPSLLKFRIQTEFKNIEQTSSALGIDCSHFSDVLSVSPTEELSIKQIAEVASFLSSRKGRQIIIGESARHRKVFVKYLRQFGISNGDRIAMVDVGWNGNFQTSLESIVHPLGIRVFGFYYGLNTTRPGSFRRWFAYGPSKASHWLRFYPCLVESLTPADHPSVNALEDIGKEVVPLMSGPPLADPGLICALHDGALDYSKNSPQANPLFNFKAIVESPPEYLVDLLSQFYFQKPFSPGEKESFICKHSFGDALRLSIGFERNLARWHWPQANLKVSNLGWMKYGLNTRFMVGFSLKRVSNILRLVAGYSQKFLATSLRTALNSSHYEIVSFDVFDTLLRRECGDFLGVFESVGNEIGDSGFKALRKEAEINLLSIKNAEVTLEEIYSELACLQPNADWEKVKQIELLVEERNLRPAARAVKLLNKVRRQGSKVIYISDMYLSSSWIKHQLVKNGIWQEGDEIFVSCEIGANKRTGELYAHLGERFKARSWLHVGDNVVSDIVNAYGHGLYTAWKPNSYLHSVNTCLSKIYGKLSVSK